MAGWDATNNFTAQITRPAPTTPPAPARMTLSDQQLLQNSLTACAERSADGDFAMAGLGLRQHQVRGFTRMQSSSTTITAPSKAINAGLMLLTRLS